MFLLLRVFFVTFDFDEIYHRVTVGKEDSWAFLVKRDQKATLACQVWI
jgi:hypothetical protein